MIGVKKVLILGSGALRIGQAGEFDYSGSQAIKAMKEEGIETVVINPNVATVQTSKNFADKVYFLPVTTEFVERVIKKEKPDSIMLAFGGQTALNTGIDLEKKGILKKYNLKVLGTPVKTIELTEDRELFNKELKSINVDVPKSVAVTSVQDAVKASQEIGFPVMIRAAFALGGQGSGIAKTTKQLEDMAEKAFKYSEQILVEEYLKGWKEIEYEVVRDADDNCITVCNMENFDPLGIHTGESIVIAPSQTLNNHEYQKLRDVSLKVIRHLGVVGECNIQFALNPKSDEYRVIEVNARLSRSSALASKATGYPLAFVAAKLGLGYSLLDLPNSITKNTKAIFEPALDYIVVKIPRWDLKKFRNVTKIIGTEMKSVGEVMAIGKTFEEAIQKAIRMLQIGAYGLVGNKMEFKKLVHAVKYPTDERLFAVVEAIQKGVSPKKIRKVSGIDDWFLYKIKNVVETKNELEQHSLNTLPKELMEKAKKQGYNDKQISMLLKIDDELEIRKKRIEFGIKPVIKQIDTLAAEYPAQTNYLYLTYNGVENDVSFEGNKKVIVLGSGAYKIGSSVEFDFCCVSCAKTLLKNGYETIMINYNPETVSTDYDECNKLYFDELSLETVMDIYEYEKPLGLIVSMGGQIPNNLALKCKKSGLNVLGTKPEDIDKAENRHKFSRLCDELKIPQPEWKELTTMENAMEFSNEAGYPVLVRPSYVLSGSAMAVAFNEKELENYLGQAVALSKEYPVVISKFILNAKEVEIDAVAKNGEILILAVTEHVENAGVHSGDATMVLPPQKTYLETVRKMKVIAKKLASELHITGPFNIQFIAKNNEVKVIECNLRSSRSIPFVSKVTGTDFIEVATNAITTNEQKIRHTFLELDHVGVKAPQFSFSRLKGADPVSGVEMASTGEVGCIGSDFEDAFLKAMLSTSHQIPRKNILISLTGEMNRNKLLPQLISLRKLGFELFATNDTQKFLKENKIESQLVHKIHQQKHPNLIDYLHEGKIDLAIIIADPFKQIATDPKYDFRRAIIDYNVPLITNLQIAESFIYSILRKKEEDLEIKSWDEYV